MLLSQNGSSLVAGRTVTYGSTSELACQAVIVEIHAQKAELDNGDLILLTALTLVVSDEQWRPITGFSERYLLSSYGKVVSLSYARTGRHRLLQVISPQRYPSVSLHDGIRVLQVGLNRLVAQHFLPPPTETRLDHLLPKDGNHLNVRADNLQWVDQQESADQAVQERFHRHGARNANSKLTPELVRQIRALAAQGHTNQQLAVQFGVSRPAISGIVRRLSWRNV